MATIEIHSRVTRRSLMNRTKDELASRVLELLDALDRERALRKGGDDDLELVRTELNRATDEAAYARCADGCQDRAAGELECADLCRRAGDAGRRA